MFWYNGKLMASGNTKVLELNLADIPSSTILCNLPKSGLLSLFEVSHSCDSTTVFAIFANDMFVLNPLDCSLTHYCSIPAFLEGTSANFMYMPPPPCEIHLDLDALDETAPGIDYRDTIYCQLPEKYLLSLTDLFSDKDWDSLNVWIDQGPSGIALSGLSPSFAVLHGQQTTSLNYYPTSLSDFTALGPYLNDLSLSGIMPDGVTNVRIGFTGYADYLVSDTAYAYITLIGRSSHAGRDSSAVVCKNDFSFSLPALLSDEATAGGIWSPAGLFDPKEDAAGVYQYIVSDAFCPDDTAAFLMSIFPEPVFDLGPDQIQCPGETNYFKIDLNNMDILWSTGDIGNETSITSPQHVWVEMTDSFDCHYFDSLEVVSDDGCIISKLFIPNIFSPNGDGFNDTWGIAAMELFSRVTMSVFDRWGNIIYYTDQLPFAWDGRTRKNQMANPGVYTYVFELVMKDDSYLKKGNVTLVR
ncbi:MAG: gliding motility-associated C-terminal domain-containing protein [Bacteroidota bacterium]|nr:gliding motility-associated C-terminal domain-containing protein [Bacteroidota bacterium]